MQSKISKKLEETGVKEKEATEQPSNPDDAAKEGEKRVDPQDAGLTQKEPSNPDDAAEENEQREGSK